MPDISDVKDKMEDLALMLRRFKAGEKITKYRGPSNNYNYFDYHCSKCGTFLSSTDDEFDIPFEKDAICKECQKTPEQKEAEVMEKFRKQRERDIKEFERLKKTLEKE